MSDLLLANLRTIGTHHCDGEVGKEAADEIERLRAELAALRDKALRFDLDQAGIERREAEAVELVELRAELAVLRAELESAHAAQRHAEKELSQYMAWYAMAEHQHLHEQRRAEKAEAERDALRAAGEAALRTLDNVRVFVVSRERIHRPSGEEWFEGCVKALRAALGER